MRIIQQDVTTSTGRIEFELESIEYAAIGRVMTQWAYLEHCIFAITAAISSTAKISIPKDAFNNSFKRRLKALRLLVEEHETED